jgi:hypothetical protein
MSLIISPAKFVGKDAAVAGAIIYGLISTPDFME